MNMGFILSNLDSRFEKASFIILIGLLIAMIVMIVLETRKKHCKICEEKIPPGSGNICGSCYADEMLAGRLPDRRRRKDE